MEKSDNRIPFPEKLFQLRAGIQKIAKKRENDHFKSNYFDINDALDAVNPLLQENRLLLLQPVRGNKVYTIIRDIDPNEDGEFLEEDSYLELPDITVTKKYTRGQRAGEEETFENPQKMGSAITYYRRYTLTSLLGLEAEDDDGNAAAGNKKPSAAATSYNNGQPRSGSARPDASQKGAPTAEPSPRSEPPAQSDNEGGGEGFIIYYPLDQDVKPYNERPWLNLMDRNGQNFTDQYFQLVKEKSAHGLTMEYLKQHYRINKRDKQLLDKLFNQ